MSPLTLRDARVAACVRGSMPSVVSPYHRRGRVLPVVFLLALSGIAMATDYYVNGTAGNNTYDGLAQTWDGVHGPKQTIQAAINAAASGDTVTVAQGTYAAAITFGGRNLTLRSTAPTNWAVVCATVISAPSGTTAVTFNTSETTSAVLTGFTITSSSGRGISCSGASPVIRSCRIIGNSSYAG